MPIEHTEDALFRALCRKLKCKKEDVINWEIVKRSVDARKKPELYYSYILSASCKQEEALLKRLKNDRDVIKEEEERFQFQVTGEKPLRKRPVIIGTGPAGLFCGLELARAGFCPILLERGKDVDSRTADVNAFWEGGPLSVHSNVQFGEGGAGTFSDGKLNTLIKDKTGRNRHVLETFVSFGAGESILYDQKPHIGTDVLKTIVKRMREEIISLGGEVRFESQVTDILTMEGDASVGQSVPNIPTTEETVSAGWSVSNNLTTEEIASAEMPVRRVRAVEINGMEILETDVLVLAIGHSARDTLFMLADKELKMEAKPFAVGFRIQHPQAFINESQYGRQEAGEKDAASVLGAASYKLTAKADDGRGVYSFCMCPGGYVVNASSEEGHLAVNGMSYSGRDGDCANSAVIVTVTPEDYAGGIADWGSGNSYVVEAAENKTENIRDDIKKTVGDTALTGILFQRTLERRAFEAASGKIPIQKYGDYQETLAEKGILKKTVHHTNLKPFYPAIKGQFKEADLTNILPNILNKAFTEGMEQMNRKLSGFASDEVWLCGMESRTSSPVRICRNDALQSNIYGIYPCGEGAGYAGGITSATMDGIKVAQEIAKEYSGFLC